MKNDKNFDCVEFQRKIRDKFAEEANMNLEELIKLIDVKINNSRVYWKLKNRIENRHISAST